MEDRSGVNHGMNRVGHTVDGSGMDNRVNRGSMDHRVDGSGVSGGGSEFSFTRVLHISDVSSIAIHTISYGLNATIRQSNVIFTISGVSVAVFRLTEVGSTVIVGDTVVVSVHGWGIGEGGGSRVVRGGGRGSSGSHSDEGSDSQNGLKMKEYYIDGVLKLCIIVCHFIC